MRSASLLAPGAARGWDSVFVAAPPVYDESELAGLTSLRVRVVFLPRPVRNVDPGVIARAFRLFRAVKADIMTCDNIHVGPLIAAWLARVPVRIWFKRSMERYYEEMRMPGWRERCALGTRLSCVLATRVVTVSEAVRNQLVEHGLPGEKITVLDNPVERSVPNPALRARTRAELGFADDEMVVTTIGRAAAVKGWEVLLEAFAEIAGRYRDLRLLLVGGVEAHDERPTYERLRRIVGERGLGHRVLFSGHRNDIHAVLAASDIFAFPSHSEGNANALNEAFGAGLPCVATRVGNAPRLIRHGVTGLLVPRNDVPEMARALGSLVGDPMLRERLAKGARETPVGPTWREYLDLAYGINESELARARGRGGERRHA